MPRGPESDGPREPTLRTHVLAGALNRDEGGSGSLAVKGGRHSLAANRGLGERSINR